MSKREPQTTNERRIYLALRASAKLRGALTHARQCGIRGTRPPVGATTNSLASYGDRRGLTLQTSLHHPPDRVAEEQVDRRFPRRAIRRGRSQSLTGRSSTSFAPRGAACRQAASVGRGRTAWRPQRDATTLRGGASPAALLPRLVHGAARRQVASAVAGQIKSREPRRASSLREPPDRIVQKQSDGRFPVLAIRRGGLGVAGSGDLGELVLTHHDGQ
jgi:hypothetical protein